MQRPLITGVVLAGGLGRRMGSVDKGLQLLRGRPMVAWALERFAPQVDELLINANQNQACYARFGHHVVADQMADFVGPLAGLQAALAVAQHPLVATVPCDSPFLPLDLISRLHAGLTAANAELAVARAQDRIHPVFCLCQRSLLGHLTHFLNDENRKFGLWISQLDYVEVDFDDQPLSFENINTREELRQFD
jgi:molybdenum cofactor guanylyltransferase